MLTPNTAHAEVARQFVARGKNATQNVESSFGADLSTALAESDESRVESYRQSLVERFGNVMIQSIANDQSSMDELGMQTCGGRF